MKKLKSAAATSEAGARSEVAPQSQAVEDDPNDLLAAIRRAGNKDRLKKVGDPAVGRGRECINSLSNEGNTLATALAQLRFQVGDSDSDDDDNEISDDEWD